MGRWVRIEERAHALGGVDPYDLTLGDEGVS
ncbi:hypothetical protein MPNT_50146 [Candidatus Methylacidithermus pantelleriae]|uniref:Uncharacterized protein n=1 Tax=Candidatus Methylacidithermus pantelleriae TaxID=2744239 RepID=A0A8J2BMP9_9BACT|nr:hypothetical protein MPNT_50146 [Candidatus Methylacidithermus pantelleriae]